MVRAPTQMSGYYGETTSPIDAEGWLSTGDLAGASARLDTLLAGGGGGAAAVRSIRRVAAWLETSDPPKAAG